MRAASLIALTFTVALGVACRSEVAPVAAPEETARAQVQPQRNLTLRAQAAEPVEVASPVELSRSAPVTPRAQAERRHSRPQPKPAAPEPAAEPLVPDPILVPVATAEIRVEPAPVEPAPEDPAHTGGRELAPGKTVTIIPASSGPSLEADADDAWLPSERPRSILVGGGGTCRPRRGVRSIGSAGPFPVGIPVRRLR